MSFNGQEYFFLGVSNHVSVDYLEIEFARHLFVFIDPSKCLGIIIPVSSSTRVKQLNIHSHIFVGLIKMMNVPQTYYLVPCLFFIVNEH